MGEQKITNHCEMAAVNKKTLIKHDVNDYEKAVEFAVAKRRQAVLFAYDLTPVSSIPTLRVSSVHVEYMSDSPTTQAAVFCDGKLLCFQNLKPARDSRVYFAMKLKHKYMLTDTTTRRLVVVVAGRNLRFLKSGPRSRRVGGNSHGAPRVR